jgi:predicted nucleic acid-binding protein
MNHLIVLDTNEVVSAGLNSGTPSSTLIEKCLSRELILVTCPAIVDEYWAVLQRPKFSRFGFPPLWLDGLLHVAHHLSHDPELWPQVGPDPDDLVFLSLAKQMGAVLVTGNIKHFPKAIRAGVLVISPSEYLEASC